MFNFIPKKPPWEIPALLSASDAAFLSFMDTPLFAMTIPAKLQSYMACGIPIIAAAYGESRQIVEEAGAGLCCPPGKADELAEIIIEMFKMDRDCLREMGENARRYYNQHFNKQKLLERLDQFFNTMEEEAYVRE